MTTKDSRFTKTNMDDRALKAFDKMYLNREYSIAQICERFNIAPITVTNLARDRNLAIRPGKR